MKRLFSAAVLKKGLAALAFCLPVALFAQDELAPVTRTYAITNVNIIQAPGRKIEMGTVVVKNGLIVSVGKNVTIPADAEVIKADSMYVYAGFIDGLSRIGVAKPKEEAASGGRPGMGERPKDPGNPKPEEAGITPYNEVRTSLDASEKSLEEFRNVGFTAAQVVPYGGMMPGSGAVILLGGKSADEMLLTNATSFYSELTPSRIRVYPATVMGVMAKYRELYRQASLSKSYESSYASNRSGIQRPGADRVLESLYPVIDKKIPVLFKVERVVDAQRVLTLQSDLGFSLVLAELKEGWDIVNKVKASNAKVFLSLDLPEDKNKKDDKKGDKGKEEPKKEEKPATGTLEEKQALEKRQAEFTAKYTGQAATFHKAGVKFGFSAMNVKAGSVQENLRRMISAGLPEDVALAALTTTPAEILGLSDRLGTVDNGKIANLLISDKPYFNEKAKVRYVFVEGNLYKQEVKDTPKKSDAAAKSDIAGEWTMTTETPDGKEESKLVIKKDGSSYSGTVSSGRIGQGIQLDNVKIDGSALTFQFTVDIGGQKLPIDVSVTVEGDTFKGTSALGEYGSFPTEGKKNPK